MSLLEYYLQQCRVWKRDPMVELDKATIVWALIATDRVITGFAFGGPTISYGFRPSLHLAILHYNAAQILRCAIDISEVVGCVQLGSRFVSFRFVRECVCAVWLVSGVRTQKGEP